MPFSLSVHYSACLYWDKKTWINLSTFFWAIEAKPYHQNRSLSTAVNGAASKLMWKYAVSSGERKTLHSLKIFDLFSKGCLQNAFHCIHRTSISSVFASRSMGVDSHLYIQSCSIAGFSALVGHPLFTFLHLPVPHEDRLIRCLMRRHVKYLLLHSKIKRYVLDGWSSLTLPRTSRTVRVWRT